MIITRLAAAAYPSRTREDGIALPTVIISMAVLTLFALASLAFVVNSTPATRRTSDAKAAIAAAQAGIDEYGSRLNARPTYYALNSTGIDPDNKAFTLDGAAPFTDGRDPRGVPVPGTGGAGAFYRYQLLTTPKDTARKGLIRLKVTGTAANGQSRALTASFGQDGYLRFLYFSDIESLDPALGTSKGPQSTTKAGDKSKEVQYSIDSYRRINSTRGEGEISYFRPNQNDFADVCSRHWYTEGGVSGRSAGGQYDVSSSRTYIGDVYKLNGNQNGGNLSLGEFLRSETRSSSTPGAVESITFTCTEIRFADSDVISGPLHTNDAILIDGSPTFEDPVTESSWSDDNTPRPTDPNKRWRVEDGKPGTPKVTKPVYAAAQSLPRTNSQLRAKASEAGEGCVYSGETSVRFDGTTMWVRSPQSTRAETSTACLPVLSTASEQSIPTIPPIVYVQASTAPCSFSLPWPAAGESVPTSTGSLENPAGGITTRYDCKAGNVFVQGTLRGQTTVASSNDVIVTGDLRRSTTGDDNVLGLIPTNYAWVYHPVGSDGKELSGLPGPQERYVDAAILSLNRSFLVQNWGKGGSKRATLHIDGVIAQKFRGPVGTGGSGYIKDYTYDTRLKFLPPPYFLTPVDSPWTVQTTTDG